MSEDKAHPRHERRLLWSHEGAVGQCEACRVRPAEVHAGNACESEMSSRLGRTAVPKRGRTQHRLMSIMLIESLLFKGRGAQH